MVTGSDLLNLQEVTSHLILKLDKSVFYAICKYVIFYYRTCCNLPHHFLRCRPINMAQINRKQRNYQGKVIFHVQNFEQNIAIDSFLVLVISAFSNINDWPYDCTIISCYHIHDMMAQSCISRHRSSVSQ